MFSLFSFNKVLKKDPFIFPIWKNQPIENRQYWKTRLKAHLVITQVKQFQPSSKFIRLQQRRISFSGQTLCFTKKKKTWVWHLLCCCSLWSRLKLYFCTFILSYFYTFLLLYFHIFILLFLDTPWAGHQWCSCSLWSHLKLYFYTSKLTILFFGQTLGRTSVMLLWWSLSIFSRLCPELKTFLIHICINTDKQTNAQTHITKQR